MILSASFLSLIVLFHLEFENDLRLITREEIVIPISIILLSFAGQQLYNLIYEEDENWKVIHGYDQSHKIILTLCSIIITVCYVISLVASAYLIE